MKTFKLNELIIMGDEEDNIIQKKIPLKDGLIINREDKYGWIIEAFLDIEYYEYFNALKVLEELIIQVKITREENDPAFFITKISGINKINDNKMNVIFEGKIVDHRKSSIEKMLKTIIEEGYQGESLLKKFKELI